MKTATIKVQIPDGWELLEPDAVRQHFTREVFPDLMNVYIPVQFGKVEEWKQPEFLKPGWIAMDEDGAWWWYEWEPVISSIRSTLWGSEHPKSNLEFLKWTPPTCTDWKKSKRRIE